MGSRGKYMFVGLAIILLHVVNQAEGFTMRFSRNMEQTESQQSGDRRSGGQQSGGKRPGRQMSGDQHSGGDESELQNDMKELQQRRENIEELEQKIIQHIKALGNSQMSNKGNAQPVNNNARRHLGNTDQDALAIFSDLGNWSGSVLPGVLDNAGGYTDVGSLSPLGMMPSKGRYTSFGSGAYGSFGRINCANRPGGFSRIPIAGENPEHANTGEYNAHARLPNSGGNDRYGRFPNAGGYNAYGRLPNAGGHNAYGRLPNAGGNFGNGRFPIAGGYNPYGRLPSTVENTDLGSSVE